LTGFDPEILRRIPTGSIPFGDIAVLSLALQAKRPVVGPFTSEKEREMFSRLTAPRLSSVVASLWMALLGSTFEARAAQLDVVAPVKFCADIKTLDLSRGQAEPERIDSAELVADGPQQFCTVKGYVAPAVNFVVRLPTSGWTQRYLQLGCGGYCGGATLTSGSVDRQSSGCTAYEDKEMVVPRPISVIAAPAHFSRTECGRSRTPGRSSISPTPATIRLRWS
jgi:hypothetical protein